MPAMPLSAPWMLLVLIVPILLAAFRRRRREAAPFSSLAVLAQVKRRSLRQRLSWVPPVLEAGWWMLAAVALAGPSVPTSATVQEADLPSFCFVLDISGSMAVVDDPLTGRTRLQDLKRLASVVIGELVEEPVFGPQARFGIVAFARRPRLVCPFTTDKRALNQFLDELSVDRLDNLTNIGDALALAMEQYRKQEAFGAIILFSDGAHNVAEALSPGTAARMAEAKGLAIDVVGVGPFSGLEEADERSLQAIAEIAGGEYRKASSGVEFRQLADRFPEQLRRYRPRERYAMRNVAAETLLAALACLTTATLLRNTWLRVAPSD